MRHPAGPGDGDGPAAAGDRAERIAALLVPGTPGASPALWLRPALGRSLLDYWVDALAEAGIREARVAAPAEAGPLGEVLARDGVRVVAARGAGGSGGPAADVDLADSARRIVIVPVDGYSDVDLRPLIAFHRRHGGPLSAAWYGSGPSARPGPIVADAAAFRELAARAGAFPGVGALLSDAGRVPAWNWGGCHRRVATPDDLHRAAREAAEISPPRRAAGRRPAAFLDRDGTLIEDVPYLSDPAGIRFFPGAAESLVRLRRAGFARVLATNQSGIGRGLFTEARLAEIHAELETGLAALGASLDAIYHCPAAPPEDGGPDCPDRKPAPGLLIRGASDLGIDLAASWMVGDKMSDVLAGLAAGCRAIRLEEGSTGAEPDDPAAAGRSLVAPDLAAAVEMILTDRHRGR